MPYAVPHEELASDLAMLCLLSEHERLRSGRLRAKACQARHRPAATSSDENPAKLDGTILHQQAQKLREDSRHLCKIASEIKEHSACIREKSKSLRRSSSSPSDWR